MKLKSKELVNQPTTNGNVAFENTYYTQPTGFEKIRVQVQLIRSDICDPGSYSYSPDNGATWGPAQTRQVPERSDGTVPNEGTVRQWDSTGFVDPVNGLLLNILMEGVLQHDHPLDGMTSYQLKYRVSNDGGRTNLVEDYIVQRGEAYSPSHPIELVWMGRNALMSGAENSLLRTSQGHLLLACQISPLGPDGTYYNPLNVCTYTEIVTLIGYWQNDGRIEWDFGARIVNPIAQSTRGAIEPTLAQMDDGRILMVTRGSNEKASELPGYKWYAVSTDGGFTWSDLQTWHYSNGEAFYSPSSISQLVRHSSGRYFWFGNICPENPQANEPRHPLVAAEVDPISLMLIEDSLFTVQGFDPQGPGYQQYSNFAVHEDRANGDLLMHMTSLFIDEAGTESGDAFLYRLEV